MDGFRIIADGAPYPGPIQSQAVFARDTGPLIISGETVELGDADLAAVGAVTLSPQGNGLSVTRDLLSLNPGGVQVVCPERAARMAGDAAFPGTPAQVPAMSQLLFLLNSVNGPNDLIRLLWETDGSALDVDLDFNPGLLAMISVEVFSAGTPSSVPAAGLHVDFGVAEWPDSFAFERALNSIIVEMAWDQNVVLAFGGGGPQLSGDRVRVKLGLSTSPPGFDRFEILAGRLASFVLEDFEFVEVPPERPHPGTSEDLALLTTDPVAGGPTADPTKSIPVLTPVDLHFSSIDGDFDFFPLLVVVQLLAPGEPTISPFPGIAVNPFGALDVLAGTDASSFGPLLLSPNGTTLLIAPPPIVLGQRLLIQGIVATTTAANGIFASTAGHELTIVP